MKKEKLIEELMKLPDGIEICIFDWRKNLHDDIGDGSSVGIYSDFEIELLDEDSISEGSIPFATLNIENDDYDNNGNKL